MFGFGQLIDILKKNPKKIVFTEGNDPRILEAASRLLASNFLHPILVGNPDEIAKGGRFWPVPVGKTSRIMPSCTAPTPSPTQWNLP